MKRVVAGFLVALMLCTNIGMNVMAAPDLSVTDEVTIMSADKNYPVDKTPDEDGNYDGDYLVVVNTGVSGTTDNVTMQTYTTTDADGNEIYGYDDAGLGLIDPDSVLDEPVVGTPSYDSEVMAVDEPSAVAVGSTGQKVLMTGDEVYTKVDCTCVAIGTYCTVWVPTDDPIMADPDIMKAYMEDLAEEFDSQYAKMITMFGDKSFLDEGHGGDGDGKTAIFCYDIAGDFNSGASSYIAGYFWGADLDLPFSNASGNKCDCVHIDSYQGMGRSNDEMTLTNLLRSKGTMVHELQHMIHFSLCRQQETSFYSLTSETWINEAFSAAAQHLCYGASEADGRIYTYNNSSNIMRGYPLAVWGGSLDNYALVYFFSQYMRTCYEQLGFDGETVYKNVMQSYSNTNSDLFKVIADTLQTTKEELLVDYRVALELKNATGKYGFNGESWVEAINSKRCFTGSLDTLGDDDLLQYYGAGVVVQNNIDTSTINSDLTIVGIDTQNPENNIEVSISGGDTISVHGGTLQLTASITPDTMSQEVSWSITSGANYATIDEETGLVTAIGNGVATVRATSVEDSSAYAEKDITITNQKTVEIGTNESVFNGGRSINIVVGTPVDAEVYYTLDNTKPTTQSDVFPTDTGLTFNKVGTYTLRVLGHDPSGNYGDCYITKNFTIEKLDAPNIRVIKNNEETVTATVTMSAAEDARIYYTLDGETPTVDSTEYEEPIVFDEVGTYTVKAIAVCAGHISSDVATKEIVVYVDEDFDPLVDKEPDEDGRFDGDYLVIVNTNENNSLSVSMDKKDVSAMSSASDSDGFTIQGYDSFGKAIIAPESRLEEPIIDKNKASVKKEAASVTTHEVGSERSFYLETGMDYSGNPTYSTEDCICVSVGKYATVWVPKNDPILTMGTGTVNLSNMQVYTDVIAQEFDDKYATMMEMFGSKDYTDEYYGDNDGKTAILLYDIDGDGQSGAYSYVAGYFWALDLDIPISNKNGNNIDCIHVDSWQAMNRSTDTYSLKNMENAFGTLVHELQHMIHFSKCRENEENGFGSLLSETWINEAFSAAAQHLCYGDSEAEGRIYTYNNSWQISHGFPLTAWGNMLENYSLVYFFSQYMRTQYESLGYDGETVYKEVMNSYTNANDDLFGIIADKLGTTKEDLLVDYRIALQLKRSSGKYGFGGEAWADAISDDIIFDGSLDVIGDDDDYMNIYSAGVVVPNEDITIYDLDPDLTIVGINKSEKKARVKLNCKVEEQIGGYLVKCTAARPTDAEIYYTDDGTTPTTSSRVFPSQGLNITEPGVHNIRVLGYDPDGNYENVYYQDKLYVKQLEAPEITVTESETDDGYPTVSISAASGASIYYSLDGSNPTTASTGYEGPFTVETEGTTTVKAIAAKPAAASSEISSKDVFVRYRVSEIALDHEKVTLYSNLDNEEGKNVQLHATILPPEVTEAKLKWKSSDESVATVDENGNVTAVGTGVTSVTVSADGVSAECVVEVLTKATELNVTNSTLEITKDKGTLQLNVSALPANASNTTYTFSVEESDRAEDAKGLATVSSTGLLAAVRDGVVKVTIKNNDLPGKAGTAIEEVVYVTISNQGSYEKENKPVFTATSFTISKLETGKKVFSIIPLFNNPIKDVRIKEDYEFADSFVLTKGEEEFDWAISLTESGRNLENGLANKTYTVPVVVSSDMEFVQDIKVKVTSTKPSVTITKVTVNPAYPNRIYQLQTKCKDGNVTIKDITDASNVPGFTQNFIFDKENQTLKLAVPYNEFVKDSKNKPVLEGVATVQVDGYIEQTMAIKVAVKSKLPKLEPAIKTLNMNYKKINADKAVDVKIKNVISSKVKEDLLTVSEIRLNDTAGKSYEKIKNLVTVDVNDNGDGALVEFTQDIIPSGTYTIPLLVSSVDENNPETDFSDAKCSVKIVVKKEPQVPKLTLKTKSIKLNRNLPGEVGTIAIKSVDQHNAMPIDFIVEAADAKSNSNVDDAVELEYNSESRCLEAVMTDMAACNKYVFKCTPIFEGINENGEVTVSPITVTVNLIQKTAAVSASAKGSVDAIDRENTAITYTIKKTNFVDAVSEVEMVEPIKTTATILDASEYFEMSEVTENGTFTMKLKPGVTITKKCKYAFRFEATLENCGEKIISSKDIVITPKQSTIKLTTSAKPVFYSKVKKDYNEVPISLSANKGKIAAVEYLWEDNQKIYDVIKAEIDDDGQLQAITFDGTKGLKKGSYTVVVRVYYEDQMWEAPTSKAASYEKPVKYKIKVTVK